MGCKKFFIVLGFGGIVREIEIMFEVFLGFWEFVCYEYLRRLILMEIYSISVVMCCNGI